MPLHRILFPTLGLSTLLLTAALPASAASLQEAAGKLGVGETQSLEFTATGHWFQFGQAPTVKDPWPRFDVSSYQAVFDYANGAGRVRFTRQQADDPQRRRPAPSPLYADQYVNGKFAWNLPAPHLAQTPQAQAAAVEERRAEIWSTPQGFVKAALAAQASSKPLKDGVEVSFTRDGKYRYVGTINARNEVERVQTWIDNPVLGDTLVETEFSAYRDFGGLAFPAEIVRSQGGHPVLALAVSNVKRNPQVDLGVPESVAKATPPAVTVKVETLAPGVHYLTGGTHHSVAIEQKDHLVLVEAPLNEERSLALLAKLAEIAPGKPVRTLINTHAHFDHSGGLRSFVDAGATIVTQQLNAPYYKQVWAAPHSLNPDRLAASGKAPRLQTFADKLVLDDGSRRIEIHNIAASGHNDGFALVYLPAEKILIEADAFTPTAVGAPLPASPNPYSVNLYDNIRRLKLDVERIAALRGPRVASLDDLRAAIGFGTYATK